MAWANRTFSLRSGAWLLALVTGVVVVAIALPASAATSTFTPLADAIVKEASPTANTGTSTALRVDGGTDPDVQSYLRFSVTGVSGTVQSAKLRLWATSPTAAGPSVFTTDSTWSETAITWNNKPALSGSGVGKVTNIATSTWAEFDVTSIVSGNGTFDLVLAGTSTDGVDFQSREATNKPQLVITTQAGTDTTPPDPPTNLSATAAGATRVDLSWTAATDNVGVTNYEISRDGSVLATIGNVTAYSDITVASNTSYTYLVRALDAASNRSNPSDPATVTTPGDTTAPTAPTDLAATPGSGGGISLSWTASTDNVAVTNYDIFRDGNLLTTVGAVTTYSDTIVAPATLYSYQVKAMDQSGNTSGFSNTSSATTSQQIVTLIPTADARVEEANPSSNFGTISPLRVDGGNGVHVESYLSFTASGLVGSVRNATLRLYAISGTGDGPTVAPTVTSWTETGITWANKPAATGAPIADLGGIATGTWVDVDVTSLVVGSGTYALQLAGQSTDGVDFHSKEAPNRPQLIITMGAPDTQPPTAPTSLAASAGSPTQVDLTWSASTDDVAVANYLVYRGTTLIATVGPTSTSYSDTTVSAATTYSYTVKARDSAGNLSKASNAATVTTPTNTGAAPVIATAGDIACANDNASYNGGAGTSTACRQLYTSDLLVNGGFAAVLPLGDNQYNSGSLTQFNAVYNPTWGRVKSITHPVTGNHEYGTSGASGYFNYYGAAAGDPTKGYYSFDVGSWHLIALNSNCTKVACTTGSAQETWLRADLAANPTQCTLAFDHHARWSSGHDGDNTFMQPMWQDLYDANADVFLSGHSHDYERFAPQNATGGLDNTRGVRQFVVGTGGSFFTGMSSAHANSQVRNNNTFGILKLTLRPTSYDWKFVPEAGKTFTDSGSTACH